MTVNDYMALHYTIVMKLDDDGDWICKILEFDGCVAHDDSVLKALRNLHEAQRMWIEATLEAGQEVPMPNEEI